jgi:hypothetical protein
VGLLLAGILLVELLLVGIVVELNILLVVGVETGVAGLEINEVEGRLVGIAVEVERVEVAVCQVAIGYTHIVQRYLEVVIVESIQQVRPA